MAIQRTMSFSDWVNEYKPIEFNSIDDWFDDYNKPQFMKKAKDLIGKYLIRHPEDKDTYPDDHISMVYIEGSPPASKFFGYVVTRKPMTNPMTILSIIIIKEELDGHKITLHNY